MRVTPPRLPQRDGKACGRRVAVGAGALLDRGYGRDVAGAEGGQAWFSREQVRVHALVNRVWPRALGTTPMGMARALTLYSRGRGVRYRWRIWRGRRDRLTDVLESVGSNWPVPMLLGRWIPRHWVLVVDASAGVLHCYEPSSGEVREVSLDTAHLAQLRGPRPFAFVVPRRTGGFAPEEDTGLSTTVDDDCDSQS